MKLEQATLWTRAVGALDGLDRLPQNATSDTRPRREAPTRIAMLLELRRRVIDDGPLSQLRASHRQKRVLWRRRGAQRVISPSFTRGDSVSEWLHPRGAHRCAATRCDSAALRETRCHIPYTCNSLPAVSSNAPTPRELTRAGWYSGYWGGGC